MYLQQQIIEIIARIDGLEKLYELVSTHLAEYVSLFWNILIGVFTILSLAIYFFVKSLVSAGVDKGLQKFNEEVNKLNSLIQNQEREIEILKRSLGNHIEYTEAIQTFRLPLCENVQGYLDIYKIGSLVFLSGNVDVSKCEKDNFGQVTIGLTPEGYRPLFSIKQPLWNTDINYSVLINHNGYITLLPDNINKPTISDSMAFPILLSFPSYSNSKQKN